MDPDSRTTRYGDLDRYCDTYALEDVIISLQTFMERCRAIDKPLMLSCGLHAAGERQS